MCGRYTQTKTGQDLVVRFECKPVEVKPRYNIAPTQNGVVIVPNNELKSAAAMQWGLIPRWRSGQERAKPLINARSETLLERASFRDSFRKRRCLVPADGFFEWGEATGGKGKQPYYFRLQGSELFAFAGLWDKWEDRNGAIWNTYTIITVPPNPLVGEIHNRMPAILERENEDVWIDPNLRKTTPLLDLLKPYPHEKMKMHPVSSKIDSTHYDTPACIQPLSNPNIQREFDL